MAAHSMLGKRVGLSAEEVVEARKGESDDPQADALLRFTQSILRSQGHVEDAELAKFREAGYDDAAVAGQDDGRVIVRIDRSRDVTGRQEVSLALGDSAPAPLTLETIVARESGRGLAIVRDLVREWRGHLVVRPETVPFTKAVGACFPL
jgi:hypothetical protein